jgi:tetratricopeptide (TPR) repeat protein
MLCKPSVVPVAAGQVLSMRTINFRFIGFLMLATALVSVAAYGLHAFQVRRNSEVLLREAKNAKDRKDLSEAIDFLDRYVALVPKNNVGPLSELGLLQADARRMGEAYNTLEKALRQDSSLTEVRRRLVEVALVLQRFPDARHHVEVLLNGSPTDVELLILRGQALAGMQEYDVAVESLKEAMAKAPDNLDNYARLALLLHGSMKKPGAALAVLDRMVDENPGVARGYVVRGAHRLNCRGERPEKREDKPSPASVESNVSAQHEPPGRKPGTEPETLEERDAKVLAEALADARRALELAADDEAVIVFGVRCLLANDKQQDAGELARRGQLLFPKSPRLYSALADVELNAGNPEEAMAWLRQGLKAVPQDRDLVWNLSNLLIDGKHFQEAEQNLERLRAIGYPKPPIAFLQARSLVQKGEWFEASHSFEGLRAALTEFPQLSKQADFLLGQCYEQLGRTDLQLTAFRRATGADSRWIPARLGVATGLLASGRIDEAIDEYREIAALTRAPASVLAQLTRLLILANLRRTPKEQDWDIPNQLLERIAEIDSASPVVPLLRAEILVNQGKSDEAEALLKAARDNSPKTYDFWLALAMLADRRDEPERVQEILHDARATLGDSVPLRITQARIAVGRQGAEAKEALRRLASAGDGFSNADRVALFGGLAGLTLAIGDYEETERLCNLVAAEEPSNLRIRLLLFDVAFRTGRTKTMEQVLVQVQQIERSGPLWHYGEAVRLSVVARDEKQPKLYAKAIDHLTAARIARPGWSRIPLLLAQITDEQGDDDAAISNYTQAVNLGERDAGIISRAVSLLYQRRRFAEADRFIRHLQEQQSPFSNELTRLATDISLRLNDSDRALNLVTKVAEKSKDPADHIWAGRIFIALGRFDEAEKNFREAIALDESASAAWVGLIYELWRAGQTQKADAALEEAGQKIKPADVPLALAEALEQIGRTEEAELRYKDALEASPGELAVVRRNADFYMRHRKFAEAEPLLARILEDKEKVTGNERLLCRRNLALALLARNDLALAKKALELVSENLKQNSSSQADLQTRALILALSPERASRLEAAQLLEQILADRQAESGAEARFVLASLYLELGDVQKAAGHLRTLIATSGDEPRYLVFYVRFLLTQKQFREAELYHDILQKRFPQEINTLALATDIAFAREKYESILPAVELYLSQFQGREADNFERMRLVASLLVANAERLRRTSVQKPEAASAAGEWASRYVARAEALFRRNAEPLPKNALAQAAFYGSVGRHAEALDLLEQNLSDAKTEEVMAVTGTLLRPSAASNENLGRAVEIIESTMLRNNRPQGLVLAMADLENWRGKFSVAEHLYREVLQKDPKNASALNNLALVLALCGRGSQEPLTLIQKAIEIAGPVPALLDSRATIYLALGDTHHAAEDLAKAQMRNPTPGSYFRRAQVELRLGNRKAAIESFAKAGELGLKTEELHPLERPIYRQLQAELQ